MTWLEIAWGLLGWTMTCLATLAAWRFYRKAVIYDEIFQYLAGDIDVNLKQFRRMSVSPVLSGDNEIQDAHRNMMVMAKRLDEILNRMEGASGLSLRPPPPLPRPKYTDR